MLIPISETTDLLKTLMLCNLRVIPFVASGGYLVFSVAVLNGLCGSV